MTRLRVLVARLLSTLGLGRSDSVLSDELQLHFDLLIEDFRRQGLSDEDAQAAARRAFGNEVHVREVYRRTERLPSVDALMQDVRYACRRLLADRTSTFAAAGLLTLGISSTVLMADMLDRLLMRPPPHVAAPDRVARVYSHREGGSPTPLVTNYVTVEAFERGTRADLEHAATYFEERIGTGRGDRARQVNVVACTDAYFDVLGLVPALGALPATGRATPDFAVISYGFWQRHFGGSPAVLGRALRLGKGVHTIVGVTPRGFAGIDRDAVDVWVPLATRINADGHVAEWRTSLGYHRLRVIARLRQGVDRAQAALRASAVYRARPRPPRAPPEPPAQEKILFAELAHGRAPGGSDTARLVGWIAVVSALVLLIACGNVASLLLVRGLRRGPELSLKTSLGASRLRLMREIFVEAAELSVAAGVLALLVVAAAGTLVSRLLLPPVLTEYASLDVRVVAMTAAICAMSALLLGLIPALRLTSRRFLDPVRSMHAHVSSRALDAFAGAQVALSLPLMVGASLFSLSLWQARQVDFGLDSTHVAVVSMNEEEVGSQQENHAAHRRILEHLRRLPQVRSAALVQSVPMMNALSLGMDVPGHPWGEGWHTVPYVYIVDPSFFDVMGLRFVAGRPFTTAENVSGGRPVLVVNEAMARLFWSGRSALGQCVYVYGGNSGDDASCSEIVGVVANAAMWPALDVTGDSEPRYYVPIEQYLRLSGRAVLVRTAGSPDRVLSLLRREAQATGRSLPFIDVWAFDDVFQPALKPLRLGAAVFVGFGVLALIIAAIGLAAMTAYGVARRTREFGIRLVLGAEPAMLVRHTLARSLVAVGLGLAAGSTLAYIGSRWMQSVLFGVAPTDLRVYVGGGALLGLVAAVAAYVSARRAGNVEPVAALRTE